MYFGIPDLHFTYSYLRRSRGPIIYYNLKIYQSVESTAFTQKEKERNKITTTLKKYICKGMYIHGYVCMYENAHTHTYTQTEYIIV